MALIETGEPEDDNPYRAPETNDLSSTDDPGATALGGTLKLYSPWQVGLATFFCSPIGGFWLIASNYRSLGKRSQAIKTLLYGGIATFLFITVVCMLPSSSPTLLIGWASIFAVYKVAKVLQGESYDKHITLGGRRYSNWRAIGVSLLCLAVVLVVFFIVAVIAFIVLEMTGHGDWVEEWLEE